MSKAVILCVIAIWVGTPAVLGEWAACVSTQQMMWNKDLTTENKNFKTDNFQKEITLVRDLKGQENAFSALQSNGQSLPKVTLNGKAHELQSLDIFPLDSTKTSAAAQLTFAYPSAKAPQESIIFLVPLVEDDTASVNFKLQWDLNRLTEIGRKDTYDFDLKFLPAVLKDVVTIPKAPRSSNGSKNQVFLAKCQTVRLLEIESIVKAEPEKVDLAVREVPVPPSPKRPTTKDKPIDPRPAVSTWAKCAQIQLRLWDEKISKEDITLVVNEYLGNDVQVVPASGGNQNKNEFLVEKIGQSPLPKVTVEGKAYELKALNLYPISTGIPSAAMEVTFASTDSIKPKEYVTFVVPHLSDADAKPNPEGQWDIYRIANLGTQDTRTTNFKWLRQYLNNAAKIGKVPKYQGEDGSKHQMLSTPCKNVRWHTLKPIFQ